MAELKQLIVSRFRTFKKRTRIDVAPIVIMIGKNGSGKSVLTKLLLILSDSLHNGKLNIPIDLEAYGVRHALEFSDIPHMKSSAMPFEIGASVEINGTLNEFIATIRFVKEREALVLDGYKLSQDGEEKLTISLVDDAQLEAAEPQYVVRCSNSAETSILVGFAGLHPLLKGAHYESWGGTLEAMRLAIPKVSYLGPFRAETGFFIGSPRPYINELGSRGEHTTEVLADDKLRSGGKLIARMNDWFQTALSHSLELRRGEGYSRVVLRPSDTDLSITLTETGAGFSQVLPVVAQHLIAQLHPDAGQILTVEQPELHLHPAVHGHLSDLFISTIETSKCIVFLETHSEQLIMRVRRRIAEGLDPRKVVIWSVGHSGEKAEGETDVALITFDEAGNPSDWPAGVFEESFEELGKMRTAARGRGK